MVYFTSYCANEVKCRKDNIQEEYSEFNSAQENITKYCGVLSVDQPCMSEVHGMNSFVALCEIVNQFLEWLHFLFIY